MKRIALEEHFSTQEHMDCLRSIVEGKYPVQEVLKEAKDLLRETPWIQTNQPAGQRQQAETRRNKLFDLGDGRLKDMDEDGIDIQVLSLVVPGVQMLDDSAATALAVSVNNELAKAIKKRPGRFIGLATVAPQQPEQAAAELKRAITELGFKGACINSHTRGEYLDDKKYWPILAMAEKMHAPIYIHARAPSPEMVNPYLTYPGLSSAILGYGAEVSLHSLRLIFSGAFDEFPGLKIIIGHLGEALPFWIWRIDHMWQRRTGGHTLKRKPSDYLRDNFFLTTSGMNWTPALLCTYLAFGADNTLFAVDYPFESNRESVSFMDSAPIGSVDKEKIMHGNAEKLFRL